MSILKSLGIEEYTEKFKKWIEKKLNEKQDKDKYEKLVARLNKVYGVDFSSEFNSDFSKDLSL